MNHRRRFPFIAIGLVLITVSVAPTIIGFVRSFQQLERGNDGTSVTQDVQLAFHPIFIACGALGLVFVVLGVVWFAVRRNRTEA